MSNKYFSLNQVPLGTKMIIKETKEEVELVEIQNFPTTFIVCFSNGTKDSYLTHEVDIIDWPKEI
tara:strand:- start:359 stop:553 length:195 start_codon:yes stop_codon:yes gene_type:complete